MNIRCFFRALLISATILTTAMVVDSAGQSDATEIGSRRILFKPPSRGAPKTRIGGGVRGSDSDFPYLTVLTPEEMGVTVSESPTMYWYQSKDTTIQFEMTLNREYETVFEVKFAVSGKAGINKIDLSDHGVKLELDVEYEWNLALVPDAQRGSKDITSSVWIKRVKPTPELAASVNSSSQMELPYVYAQHGIWCETFDALSQQIDTKPEDESLRLIRADLLKQAALETVAEAMTNQGGTKN